MTIRETFGKHTFEVSGTEEQVVKAVAAWRQEIAGEKDAVSACCEHIRSQAAYLGVQGAGSRPIRELVAELELPRRAGSSVPDPVRSDPMRPWQAGPSVPTEE